ncbi:protein neprosin-like [Rhododendron vialii]|uniref:protein neprosin-like n=1 Tax=Rhododendron vialii TaxID=182163 RepID=UPI00265F9B40|nr:protein neprosin-like [Rhododendron vialii]
MSDQRMDISAFLLVLFSSSLFVCHSGVEGGIELSATEDLEFENQLELLNKPSIKIIQTEYGDIYDCVDFYNQPAFDHPLLKNHNIRESVHIGLKDGGCPFGTVPIRRITKEDLIKERNVSKIRPLDEYAFVAHWKGGVLEILLKHVARSYCQYAVVRTKRGAGKFNGVRRLAYTIRKYLEVDPDLYGDTRTRAFIRVDGGMVYSPPGTCTPAMGSEVDKGERRECLQSKTGRKFECVTYLSWTCVGMHLGSVWYIVVVAV